MYLGFYLADQNPHRDRTTGITVYTRKLLEQLEKRTEISITAISSMSSFRPQSASVVLRQLPFPTDGFLGRVVADHCHGFLIKQTVDLWHYPKGFLPLLFLPREPIVGTVCDVILQFYADRYPQARSTLAYSYWLNVLRRSISRFDAILTISNFSKNQIEQFCERHRIHCPRIFVTYLASRWDRDEVGPPMKENYILHLASTEPHKQTATLLRLWKTLQAKRKELPRLVLVGKLDVESENLAATISSISRFPQLPEPVLMTKMSRARALIIPSEIEGFGLPALEAYEMRTPVVFATGTSIGEILGTETHGEFDLHSFDSFDDALTTVLALDSNTVEKEAVRLREKYSWSRCADQTVTVYKRALQTSHPKGSF